MKISIVTWDASFRESLHTIDYFAGQNFKKDQFEFIWCDAYPLVDSPAAIKIDEYKSQGFNFSYKSLDLTMGDDWHLGKILNQGLKQATGDIIVVPDGDIVIKADFLKKLYQSVFDDESLVMYFRRWDEPKKVHGKSSLDVSFLEKETKLFNTTNYGGCFAIHKNAFTEIGFYEESKYFSGPGANGLEQYYRFRNKGLKIQWSAEKIYHPYHDFTGESDKKTMELEVLSKKYPWIVPYQGLYQSWIVHCRGKSMDWKANDSSILGYLKRIPDIDAREAQVQTADSTIVKKIKGSFF